MATLLELIDVERNYLLELHTRFALVAAIKGAFDQRLAGRTATYANRPIELMIADHRGGSITNLAGWIRSICADGGFFQRVISDHLGEIKARSEDDQDVYARVLNDKRAEAFLARFPRASGRALEASDIEQARDVLLHKARAILENADAIRSLADAPDTPLTFVDLVTTQDVIKHSEDLLNDLSVFAGGPFFMYTDHHLQPSTKVVARDLVDLLLLGAVDSLVFVTGASDRLNASGARWAQYREGFWEAVAQVAPDFPDKPINDPVVLQAARARVSARPLTTPQIERLVNHYRLEYARYDAVARSVEDKLRRALVRARVKALIGSRTKDPDSLRGKLDRKRTKYDFGSLEEGLGTVVTDLAGVRVILYDDQDSERVAQLVGELWHVRSDETKAGEYKARHVTIEIKDPESRATDGALCEIQLVSLASHAFNELEHDIRYKDHDVDAGPHVKDKLDMLRQSTDLMATAIRQLIAARKDEITASKIAITSGLDLGAILDRVYKRRVTGDFDALLYLWQGVEPPPTREVVEQLAPVLQEIGPQHAPYGADDATTLAFALFAGERSELLDIAREYPNQDSTLIRAILDSSDG